jgi:hypothetical protein
MRKRNYVMGLVAVLAISVVAPSAAHAAITGNTMSVVVSANKQDKKIKGPADIGVTIDTQHSFPDLTPGQTASNAVVDFDKNFAFNSGKIKTCNPALLAGTTTEAAKAACPGTEVGKGDAGLCTFAGTCSVTAVVTAFNGVKSGGNLVLLLHTRTSAGTTSVLLGQLITSPLGGEFGKRLDVTVPDTTPTGQELVHFFTSIPKTVSEKKKVKDKKTGKKKTVKSYYISASCSNKSWEFRETNTYRLGGGQQTASATVPCTQKKAKK